MTRRIVLSIVVFLLSFILSTGIASAAYAIWYKTTSSPMAARTAYGYGLTNVTFHQISSCQNPSFLSNLYLKTTGGSTIRYWQGYCGHAMSFPTESTVNAFCGNLAYTYKYAACYKQG